MKEFVREVSRQGIVSQQLSYIAHEVPNFSSILNQIVEKYYHEHELKISQLAKELGFSERKLYKLFQSNLGITPSKYLNEFRMRKALVFIKSGQSIKQAALNVGFSNQSYFSSCFKKFYGMSPSKFSYLN